MKLYDNWKWVAKDIDGVWRFYSKKPKAGLRWWWGEVNSCPLLGIFSHDSFPDCDWKESLHQIINGELVKYIDLKVNDKVMVTDSSGWVKRYFSHFSEDGTINCFVREQNSWTTTSTNDWIYWRLPTEEELKNETK